MSRWLEAFVRRQCTRPEARVEYLAHGRDDRSTLESLRALLEPLSPLTPLAKGALLQVEGLLRRCDRQGRLTPADQQAVQRLVGAVEQALG